MMMQDFSNPWNELQLKMMVVRLVIVYPLLTRLSDTMISTIMANALLNINNSINKVMEILQIRGIVATTA